MTDETQAAELPRQDNAFQAAVDEATASISDLMQDGNTADVLDLEVERALWDFAATWTALLQEQAVPAELHEDNPEHDQRAEDEASYNAGIAQGLTRR